MHKIYNHEYFTVLLKGTRLPFPPSHFYGTKFLEMYRDNHSHNTLKPTNFNITIANHNGNQFFCNSD